MPASARPSWDDIQFLEALDRLGTPGRVARELGVSASTVYRRIGQLEETIGARCLVHGTGRLTDIGLALAAVGRQTAASLAQVSQQVRFAEQDIDGEVSLTTVEGFIPLIAGPLADVLERFPRLRVSLHVLDQGPSVRRREVDVALAVIPSPPQGLWGRRLFAIRYGAFGTAHAVARAPRRWIVGERTAAHAEWEKEHAVPVVARTSSLATMIALARHGAGVAIMPKRLAALEPSLVEAIDLGPSLEALDRPAWLLTHPDLQEAPRVRLLMEALIQALR